MEKAMIPLAGTAKYKYALETGMLILMGDSIILKKKFKASGIIGETIAKARIIQTSPLMIAHLGLIILCLGSSLFNQCRISHILFDKENK